VAEKLKIRYGKNKTISVRVKGRLDPISPFKTVSRLVKASIQLFSEYESQKTTEHMASDIQYTIIVINSDLSSDHPSSIYW
jgi:hypothetical protein